MSGERDADRDVILRRRALFLASTLGGLSLGAAEGDGAPDGASSPASPASAGSAASSTPTDPTAPAGSARGRHQPMICLSDDPIEVEPLRRIPLRTTQSVLAVCLSVVIDHSYRTRRQETPMLGLRLRAPVVSAAPVQLDGGATGHGLLLGAGLDAMAGVALTRSLDARVQLGFSYASGAGSLLQPGGTASLLYNLSPTLWSSVGAGGGYLWLTGDDRQLRMSPGPFAQIDLAPFGLRTGGGLLEFGPRIGLTWSRLRSDDGERFGFASVSMGLDFTYLFGSSAE